MNLTYGTPTLNPLLEADLNRKKKRNKLTFNPRLKTNPTMNKTLDFAPKPSGGPLRGLNPPTQPSGAATHKRRYSNDPVMAALQGIHGNDPTYDGSIVGDYFKKRKQDRLALGDMAPPAGAFSLKEAITESPPIKLAGWAGKKASDFFEPARRGSAAGRIEKQLQAQGLSKPTFGTSFEDRQIYNVATTDAMAKAGFEERPRATRPSPAEKQAAPNPNPGNTISESDKTIPDNLAEKYSDISTAGESYTRNYGEMIKSGSSVDEALAELRGRGTRNAPGIRDRRRANEITRASKAENTLTPELKDEIAGLPPVARRWAEQNPGAYRSAKRNLEAGRASKRDAWVLGKRTTNQDGYGKVSERVGNTRMIRGYRGGAVDSETRIRRRNRTETEFLTELNQPGLANTRHRQEMEKLFATAVEEKGDPLTPLDQAKITQDQMGSMDTQIDTLDAQIFSAKRKEKPALDEKRLGLVAKRDRYSASLDGFIGQSNQVAGGTAQLSAEDQEAMAWLKSNPNDPTAPTVRARLVAAGIISGG